MKRVIFIITAITICIVLMTAVSCGSVSQEKQYPERYEQYVSLLGEKREKVLEVLGYTESDITSLQNDLYCIPETAQYGGLVFDVILEFDVINDRLLGFYYTKEWKHQWNEAIDDVWKLSEAITGTYGEARKDIDRKRFCDMSKEQLAEAFHQASNNEMQVETDYWLVENLSSATILEYAKIVRDMVNANEMSVTDHPGLTLEMKVVASEQYDQAKVLLRFRLDFILDSRNT